MAWGERRVSAVAAWRRGASTGALALVGIAAVACATPGSPASNPEATPASPGASDTAPPPEGSATGGSAGEVSFGEDIELAVGASASITETAVTFTLAAASGPAAGCNDCPN
jgi:hypothetical protein